MASNILETLKFCTSSIVPSLKNTKSEHKLDVIRAALKLWLALSNGPNELVAPPPSYLSMEASFLNVIFISLYFRSVRFWINQENLWF